MSNIILTPFVPGTVKPEEDYVEFARLGQKLGLPCPQAHISLESTTSDGIVHETYTDRSRTLTRNYWNWLFKAFAGFNNNGSNSQTAMSSDTTWGAGHMTQKTTAAVVVNPNTTSWDSSPSAVIAGATSATGIVVGTGTAAESFDGHALATQVVHGNGAGELNHNSSTLAAPSYNGGTLTWTWVTTRIFNNNSGGTIVIAETGIYGTSIGPNTNFMLMRDLLGATVSVLDAGQLTVTYTFTLTFPA